MGIFCHSDMVVTNTVDRARRSPDFSLLFPCNSLPIDSVTSDVPKFSGVCFGQILRALLVFWGTDQGRAKANKQPSAHPGKLVRHSGLPSRILRAAQCMVGSDCSELSPAITYPPGQMKAQGRFKFYFEKYKQCESRCCGDYKRA